MNDRDETDDTGDSASGKEHLATGEGGNARRLQETLAKLSDEEADLLIRQVVHASSFSGPLPPPEVLREYGEVVPGLSEKIVEMADREQRHRHNLETRDQQDDRKEARRGQFLGAVTMLALLGGSILVTYWGYWYVGIALLAAPVVETIGKLLRRGDPDDPR